MANFHLNFLRVVKVLAVGKDVSLSLEFRMEIATEDTRMYTFANERPTDRQTDSLTVICWHFRYLAEVGNIFS